jgi:hypothetical protein
MSDEPVTIEATAGPYAGQRLTVPAADAKQAIADGWARDPFAEVTDEDREKDRQKAAEMTDEDKAKVAEAAEKAARKLRGEDEAEENGGKGKKGAKDKSLEADKPESGYETRSNTPKSK